MHSQEVFRPGTVGSHIGRIEPVGAFKHVHTLVARTHFFLAFYGYPFVFQDEIKSTSVDFGGERDPLILF